MRCYCGAKDYKLLFLANGFQIAQCLVCGQVRTITPSKIERKQIYNKEDISVYIEKEAMFRKLFKRVVDFIQCYKKGGSFLEIGAGVGLLVDEARKAGFDTSGFEPSSAAVLAAKKFFGVKLHRAKFSKNAIKKRVDIIILNHVLEHLQNPQQVVNIVNQSLRDDGILVIGVPNFNSIMSQIKKNRWQNLIPAQHRWHFTLQTLDALILPFGFMRKGFFMENHDRSMHPLWKHLIYWVLDNVALTFNQGEAMLVVYQKL